MEEAGFRVTGTSREDFSRTIAADTVTWGRAVAATGFKADGGGLRRLLFRSVRPH